MNIYNIDVFGFCNSPEYIGDRLADSLTSEQAGRVAGITVDITGFCYVFWKRRPTALDITSIKSDQRYNGQPLQVFHYKATSGRSWGYVGSLKAGDEHGLVMYG
jgi:hypothetical protein